MKKKHPESNAHNASGSASDCGPWKRGPVCLQREEEDGSRSQSLGKSKRRLDVGGLSPGSLWKLNQENLRLWRHEPEIPPVSDVAGNPVGHVCEFLLTCTTENSKTRPKEYEGGNKGMTIHHLDQ